MSNTNWKKIHSKILCKAHQPPEGWDSRDYVASQLQCSPDKVSQILSPGIKSGDVEVKMFAVWDKNLKRVVQKTFYRETTPVYEENFSEETVVDSGRRVYCRKRRAQGTYRADGSVLWDNGKVSYPSKKAFKKCDIKFIS
jgi:hypothetical protein